MTMTTGVLLGIPNGSSNNWRNRRPARRTYRRVRCLVYRYEGLSDIINKMVTTHRTFAPGVYDEPTLRMVCLVRFGRPEKPS